MQVIGGEPKGASVVDAIVPKFDVALDRLAASAELLRSSIQTDVHQLAETLMGSAAGLCALYERAHRFEDCGVFAGGPWSDASKLQPALVAGCLKSGGVYPVVETLSELRVLAIAKGRYACPQLTQSDALQFLNQALALNLEFLFPGDTEQERIEGGPHWDSNVRLFALLADELELGSLRQSVVAEIEQVCAQRPIMTNRLQRMIELADRIPVRDGADQTQRRLASFVEALHGPTPISRRLTGAGEYRDALAELSEDELQKEAAGFAEAMNRTGLCAPQHAVLLRRLTRVHPELLPLALGLDAMGEAGLTQSAELVQRLIRVAVLPTTCRSIYGLARLLERGLLSRNEVAVGLERIVDLDLRGEVRQQLLSGRSKRDGASANAVLLAGAIAVLGQPLGIGQGRNPSCQAARGLSLWAEHAPGYLLGLLISAAREGFVEMSFEGTSIRSDNLIKGVTDKFDLDLDPVSQVLAPHLDRMYDEMMRRTLGRATDGHRWVNPALYGRWVPSGFTSAFDPTGQAVVLYEDFIRRFFATHHPAFNDGHTLMYPNPVGICITNSHGEFLGLHAVSIRRVAEDPEGDLRVYFFNPNNEGRQDWGFGVTPTVNGFGEERGESSLRFEHFASRIYAFHYNVYEEGDAFAVPDAVVERITASTRKSWARVFNWINYPP